MIGTLALARQTNSITIDPYEAENLIISDNFISSLARNTSYTPNTSTLLGQYGSNVQLGYSIAYDNNITGSEWDCLFELGMRESGWNEKAKNPISGAFGIAQSLPASKILTHGDIYDPEVQIRWMLDYIKERYDTPCLALAFQIKNNWY